LNLRAFKVSNPIQRPRLRPFTGWADETSEDNKNKQIKPAKQELSKNLKQCMFCKIGFLQYELTNKLTLKMIIDMEKMINHMGLSIKWIDFSDAKYYEKSLLYQTFRVWHSCTILYNALTELK